VSSDVSRLPPPEFSKAISSLQFGVTFKTTRPGRHQHSDQYLSELYSGSKPVILDVGASDGSTSLDLLKALGYCIGRYYVTDLSPAVRCGYGRAGVLYFLDDSGECVLRASKRFLIYSDFTGARFPLPFIAGKLLALSRTVVAWQEVKLIQPELVTRAANDSRITIMRYDMFTPWTGERPDLIKVANLLNGRYFSEAQIKRALIIQCSNLASGGRLLLVSEDYSTEKFSIFRKSSTRIRLEHTHNGGAKASHLVPSVVDPWPHAGEPLAHGVHD